MKKGKCNMSIKRLSLMSNDERSDLYRAKKCTPSRISKYEEQLGSVGETECNWDEGEIETEKRVECKRPLPKINLEGDIRRQAGVFAKIMKKNMKDVPRSVEDVYIDIYYDGMLEFPFKRCEKVPRYEAEECKYEMADKIADTFVKVFKKNGLDLDIAHDWAAVLNPRNPRYKVKRLKERRV